MELKDLRTDIFFPDSTITTPFGWDAETFPDAPRIHHAIDRAGPGVIRLPFDAERLEWAGADANGCSVLRAFALDGALELRMLHFIREHHGPDLAVSVAEQFMHPRIREQGDRQRMAVHTRYRINSPKLAEVISVMEQARSDPPGLDEIATHVALSVRQVERLFQRHLGTSPSAFYLGLRLAQARTLLRESSQSVRAIAAEFGFKSTSHFSSAYRRAFAHRPTDERRPGSSPPRKITSVSGKPAASRKGNIH